MKDHSSATVENGPPILPPGLWWGALGVLAFSLTVPLTRVAVTGGLSPVFTGTGRAVVAGALAGIVLLVTGRYRRRPRAPQWLRLGLVTGGVVIGFPVCTSLALQDVPATHGAVAIAALPAATAAVTVLRTKERAGVRFWCAAALGTVAATTAGVLHSGGTGGVSTPQTSFSSPPSPPALSATRKEGCSPGTSAPGRPSAGPWCSGYR
ncbi:Putative membrane protein [Corynebacterium glyciniphilum AJ 3170]|uniref:Putative membrane protein n=1 Tax=Corynebacterium glyciniphilum AJ 3170 TaxID=1404245 RepID=X5DSG7_9CORY|nr:EamA family transporter [Corynebacterium glyciniphilum]AHW64234.1 Putative membrane protein [Corynebacterium glyciniphilum AJ 3170]